MSEGGACDTSIKNSAKRKIPAVLLHSATKNTSLKNIYYCSLTLSRCCSAYQHHILIFSFKLIKCVRYFRVKLKQGDS